VLVQADGASVLLDTGEGGAAVRNADRLNIDLKAIETIVLSHAHRDHTGGLRDMLARTGPVDVIAHPAIWEKKVKMDDAGKRVFNGVPFSRWYVESRARLSLHTEPVRLTPRITAIGEVPMVTDFETVEPVFQVEEDGTFRPDTMPDDLALAVTTDKGLVVVLGCAHRGMVNTLLRAREVTGERRIHAVLGGTHLYPKSPDKVQKAIEALKELEIERIGVSHCTGFEASMAVATAFKGSFFLNNAGKRVTF
jgi:7,8-dihydropterin-6-yl-methyl-4-(beta-D-ribofuranosyl)aminobenzene 5'-phosphate synthase